MNEQDDETTRAEELLDELAGEADAIYAALFEGACCVMVHISGSPCMRGIPHVCSRQPDHDELHMCPCGMEWVSGGFPNWGQL